MQPSWQSTVIGLGFIAFAAFGLWLAVAHDFATIWSGIGTVIGVLTGSIPAYFFKQQADQQSKKASLLAGHVDPVKFESLAQANPELFR